MTSEQVLKDEGWLGPSPQTLLCGAPAARPRHHPGPRAAAAAAWSSSHSERTHGAGPQASLGRQGRGTKHYGLIVVGHSLGAGTAAILSFLLRPQYPTLKCFAYSPPGGLLR